MFCNGANEYFCDAYWDYISYIFYIFDCCVNFEYFFSISFIR